jgi:exopolyphosphatase/guanosine-5'-triphosphate,3'-diphosphate pyrophosphatase
VGALLHEVGQFVSDSGYHKHSHYLISHSKIFGLNSLDHKLTALVARYHRRAVPKASHAAFAELDRDSRVVLCRLAGILRIAICLAQSRSRRIPSVACSIERNRLIMHPTAPVGDLSMEQLELRQNSALFQDVFGMSVLLRDNKS